jgi:signal transduction histidine kinase
MPPGTEERVGDFADLVAAAIANAASRAELLASRARIVTSADDARRRIERNLHDGPQQQLIALALDARLAMESVPDGLDDLKHQLGHLASSLTQTHQDLQEIARGLHPAILSKGGLLPALHALARRSAIPVTFQLDVKRPLAEGAEIAAYYVAAEGLSNAIKHSRASSVVISVKTDGDSLVIGVTDNGIGGSDIHKGSGLIGLICIVEARGGAFDLGTGPDGGTSLHTTLPLEADLASAEL